MTAIAPYIGDLFLSLAALAGLFILAGVLNARDPFEPLNRRFLFGIRVMMMLFLGRALIVLTGLQAFRFFVLLGAALIPLAVLLLAEGLLRRHAPLWAKVWISSGVVLFGATAFWVSDSIDPARLWGLLVFQFSGFVVGGYLVLTRNRASLSPSENETVERLALSLLLLVPLAAADFLIEVLGLPIQVSPLGVLFLCWLAISLGRGQGKHRTPLLSFGVVMLGAVASGGAVALMTGLDGPGTLVTLAVIFAGILVAVVYIEAQSLRAEDQSDSLLRHLAEDRSETAADFLRGLQAHPLVEGAAVVEAGRLDDFDTAVLARVFAASPVLRRSDPPFVTGAEGDHISHLFERYEASHMILADADALTIVALSMPSLASSPRAELELAAVQRMAQLMSKGAS